MNWVIIAVLIIAVIALITFKNVRHKIFIFFLLLLFLFFYLSFSSFQSSGVNLKSAGGVFSAVKIYFSWLVDGLVNVKRIAGNVVNIDNLSFLNKTRGLK